MARKPEIRYNRTIDDIKNLAHLQRQILECAIRYLKPNGILVYSTCTLGKIENLDNFKFLKADERLTSLEIDGKKYLEFVSFEDKTDGFFISKFKKNDYEI